jgi:hypothetical protein
LTVTHSHGPDDHLALWKITFIINWLGGHQNGVFGTSCGLWVGDLDGALRNEGLKGQRLFLTSINGHSPHRWWVIVKGKSIKLKSMLTFSKFALTVKLLAFFHPSTFGNLLTINE